MLRAACSIALMSNIMAILLRRGVRGSEFGQGVPAATCSGAGSVAAVAGQRNRHCATDLAEVIGTAIGLNLLFGIPLAASVIITALDVFLILWLQNFRWIEALIVTLLGVIAVCFAIQIAMANPDGVR